MFVPSSFVFAAPFKPLKDSDLLFVSSN